MQLGMVGLGRMGMNMVLRLLKGHHEVVAYNRSPEKVKEVEKAGAKGAYSFEELIQALKPPRVLWIMLPAGTVVDEHIQKLLPLLSRGDILVDGGNSLYKDAIRRSQDLKKRGIHFLDVGTSGGIWGLQVGYCLMIGGEKEAFQALEPIFKVLAPPNGYLYCGPSGAGHFVKMVHNGIEYGMLQAYGEGFDLLRSSPFSLNLGEIAHLWNQGSVVRSWLLELAERAFQKDPTLSSIRGYVEDSGEGRWTVLEAVERGVSAPTLAYSLFQRFRSRQKESFADQVIAALRKEFGGHAVKSQQNQ